MVKKKKESPDLEIVYESDEERDMIKLLLTTVQIVNEEIERNIELLTELESNIFKYLPSDMYDYFWYTIIPSKEKKEE